MPFTESFYKDHADQFSAGLQLCSTTEEENVMLRVIESFMVVSIKHDKEFDGRRFRAMICETLPCRVQRHNVIIGL